MALADITIDFDLAQLLGSDFDARRTKAYVTTNVESGTLMDTSTGETRLGDEAVTIAADGTGSFTTWATGADGNPISWQTSLVVDYPRTGQRDRKRRVFGPWTLTTADDGKNITALEDEQAVPPEYLTTVTTALQTYVDAGQAAATTASAAATTASGAADTAVNAAGLASEIALGDADAAFGVAQLNPTSPLSVAQGDVLDDPTHPLTAGLATTFGRGVSVTDPRFGAVGDGTTDDTAAIQEAIDLMNAAGGGEIYFPKGTYRIVTTLVIYSNVTLRGAGRDATILKLGNSANTTILRTESFATLTGTNPLTAPYGPGGFTIRDMTFDGNKDNNTSGWCAQLYAWDYTLERVAFREGKSGGLYSEWSNSYALPPSSMEAQLVNVKAHDNDGRGIDWHGPHDSLWTNVVSFLNASDGIRVGANGGGLLATNCHSWGAAQPYAWVLDGDGCVLTGCVGEGAITGQVLFTGDRNEINGGYYYAAGSSGKGFLIGKSGNIASDTIIRAHTLGFVNGSIDFTYDGGGTIADIVHVGGGTAYVGTPNSYSRARIDVPGTITHELGGFAWADYVPTLTASTTNPTLGTGSSAYGSFKQVGKTVHVRGVLAFGTGSTPGSGTYYIGLPVPRRSGQVGGPLGYILDASAGDHRPVVYQDGGTTSKVGMVVSGVNQYVTHSVPWAWADGDVIRYAFTYEAA